MESLRLRLIFIISYSFKYLSKLLKSDNFEEKDKAYRIIRVGKYLEQYYQGSYELFLFFTNYKIFNLPEEE